MKPVFTLRWHVHPSTEMAQGRVVRIGIYLQSKVLEIIDSSNSVFYLVFYKNILLGGGHVEQIRKNTYLDKAFQQGITLSTDHPLFHVFLPKDRKLIVPSSNHLFTQLQKDLSLHEIAFAATLMDSFIEKKQLIGVIREIFNHYRRNGQFLNAYLIAKILIPFSPQPKATKQLVAMSEFDKYRKLEDADPIGLLAQDAHSQELFYFQHRFEQPYEALLHHLLKNQTRRMDQLLMYMHVFEEKHNVCNLSELSQLLKQELKPEERFDALTYLTHCSTNSQLLLEELLDEQIQRKLFAEALLLIGNHYADLSPHCTDRMELVLAQVDPAIVYDIPNLNRLISTLYPADSDQKEIIIRRLVTGLLKHRTPTEVKTWLNPIKETSPGLPIFQDIDQLESLSQDIDQLTKLGELYYEFSMLDQSIDCFTWEMELNPTSLNPIRWLSKLYKEKGMLQEAEDYRKLSIALAKNELAN